MRQLAEVGEPFERPLCALAAGEAMVVSRLDTSDQGRLRKLLALGIVPGVRLELSRRSPCYVMKIGFAQLAIDESAASGIFGFAA